MRWRIENKLLEGVIHPTMTENAWYGIRYRECAYYIIQPFCFIRANEEQSYISWCEIPGRLTVNVNCLTLAYYQRVMWEEHRKDTLRDQLYSWWRNEQSCPLEEQGWRKEKNYLRKQKDTEIHFAWKESLGDWVPWQQWNWIWYCGTKMNRRQRLAAQDWECAVRKKMYFLIDGQKYERLACENEQSWPRWPESRIKNLK